MSVAYGIDFGTTNSVVATARGSEVETIRLDETVPGEWANVGFDRVLPSVIAFDGDEPLFGWKAKKRQTDKLEAVKRLFATDDSVTIGSRSFAVEEVAALFFRHLQQRMAEVGQMDKLDHAVVTIPANSRGRARYRTKASAGLAGIEVLALINEPTAAAMAHARTIGDNQRVLVFDWGGGTLDVTVLQAVHGSFIEQSSKGIQRLGGIDVDAAFAAALTPQVSGADRWSESERALFMLNLELAKIELSARTETQVALPGGGFVDVTRAQFEDAVRSIVEQCRQPVETCLRESPGRIDHLAMVGGGSKIPLAQELVASIVGTEPGEGADPMTAIAEGAALAAGILLDVVDDLDFHVGTEHALGTIVHNDGSPPEGEFSTLIRRNTKLPATATDAYVPGNDFQESVMVQVIEGDPDLGIVHDDNVVLKQWEVEMLEPRARAEAGFDITYEYDVDGILHVKVRDHKTGTIMMDDELAFGAAEDRSQLPQMRRRVDELTAGLDVAPAEPAPPEPAPSGLSAESRELIETAQSKLIPFLPDADRGLVEALVAALEVATPETEDHRRAALQGEVRNHSYLL